MKKLIVLATSTAFFLPNHLLAAENANVFNIDASVWAGHFSHQDGEVDTSGKDNDQVVGFAVDISSDHNETFYGTLSLDYEHTLDEHEETNDQTVSFWQLAYTQSIVPTGSSWIINPYIGTGESKDNGDNRDDKPTDYYFAGVGVTKRFKNTDLDLQLGKLKSSDYFGESIDNGTFGGMTLDYHYSDEFALSGRLFHLRGDRWNGKNDNDYETRITDLNFGAQYNSPSSPITYWANVDYTQHVSEGESDDPYIWEGRIGLTYHFGKANGISSHRYLPNIGRWISISANEIE